MDFDPEEKFAIVTNNGAREQSITVINLQTWKVTQTLPLDAAWLGLRFYDGGKKFLASGGASNKLYYFSFENGVAALTDSLILDKPWSDTTKHWIGGLDIDEARGKVYACIRFTHTLLVCDLKSKAILKRIDLGQIPYTCLASRSHDELYISVWGGASVKVLDRNTDAITGTIPVGDHPNDIAESPDGRRLFVANANQNTVSVIDLMKKQVIETLSSALFPDARPGSTPNSVALDRDGKTLYIANADNNCLAVMDVSTSGASRSLGFIPVGWYPSVVRVLPRSGDLLVANAKGDHSAPNPGGPVPGKKLVPMQYTGKMFSGIISRITKPTESDLHAYTASVYANTPLKSGSGNPVLAGSGSPIPAKPGDASPIKHVFYIMKENRTYDQVFGDIPEGNGDSSLTIFPEKITPNLHAIARQFILLDNTYVDAEVSADGHNWSMAAYASDYVEKSWPSIYGDFGGDFDFSGDNPAAFPSNGFIWDNCKRAGISYRNYGEFTLPGTNPGDPNVASMPSLEGHIDSAYTGFNMDLSDLDRVKEWDREFTQFEKNGNLPSMEVLYLPNDHTVGTKKGGLTPQAMMAQNDLAVGMVVDRISHSTYWKESAIFIIEDDAQAGPDHIDAHRVESLVISPYTKRHFVDHDMYSTSSLLRTMELLLGLPPMSQYDAAARPMINSFTNAPDFSPYDHRQSNIDIEAKNIAGAYGQKESDGMNFTKADAAPDRLLDEIIWKSVRGPESPAPAPVRSAFVFTGISHDKEDDD
jgi:YVTN family beta-propeller protein